MRRGTLSVAVAAAVGVWWIGGCNCGGRPCSNPSECSPGEVCQQGMCASNPDGSTGGDGGGGDGGGRDGGGGGNDGGDGGGGTCTGLQCQQVSCPGGGTTSLTGSIYDPSGTIPLYNAVVFVPNAPLQPFAAGVNCDVCGASISGAPIAITLTGPDGRFTLNNVPVGNNIPLVLQMGRWRRTVTIPAVPACTSTPITDVNMLRLPRNQSEGDIPQMAIATGDADPFECLFKKMGIDDSEFTRPDAGGRIHFYRQNGLRLDGGSPAASTLWSDAGTLARYDVVLLPCEGGENRKPDAGIANLVNYTTAGGRVFATHYSYVWAAFNQPFQSAANWQPDPGQNTNPAASGSPFTVAVNQSFPKGQAFAQWLTNVGASSTPGLLDIYDSRDDVWTSDGGFPATEWLSAPNPNNGNIPSLQHLTFNVPLNPPPLPDGDAGVQCGRVVFSDFHVATSAIRSKSITFPQTCILDGGFTPQEKALVFMLFDLSSCVQSDDTAPTTCLPSGGACSTDSQCCAGLTCRDPADVPCNGSGSGCSCKPWIN